MILFLGFESQVKTYEHNVCTVSCSQDPIGREDWGSAVMLVNLALDAHLPGERVGRGLKVVSLHISSKAHLHLSAMDNSPVIAIFNVWNIWRYDWLSTFIRVTLAEREEETKGKLFWRVFEAWSQSIT